MEGDLSRHFIVVNRDGLVVATGNFPSGDIQFVIDSEAARGNTAIFGVDGTGKIGCVYLAGAGAFELPKKTRIQIQVEIADRRWQREVGGILWGEVPVNTERDARTLLEQAIDKGERYTVWPDQWKFNDGRFRPVTAAQLREIEEAVARHVKACFAWEAAELARLDATPDADLAGFVINESHPPA